MRKIFLFASIIAITILTGACKSQKATGANKQNKSMATENRVNSPVEKYWKLVELQGKPISEMTYAKEPHFILKKEDNRVTGNAGCNALSGEYELDEAAHRIRFSKIITTRMFCFDDTVEREFLRILEMVDNYSLNGDMLTLNRARMAPLARLEAVYLK